MRIFIDAATAALAAMGIYMIFFALCSLGAKPLGQSKELTLTAKLGAKCSAHELEAAVCALVRLRRAGFADFEIEIYDLGLDSDSRKAAALLERKQGVLLISPPKENIQWTREQANLKA